MAQASETANQRRSHTSRLKFERRSVHPKELLAQVLTVPEDLLVAGIRSWGPPDTGDVLNSNLASCALRERLNITIEHTPSSTWAFSGEFELAISHPKDKQKAARRAALIVAVALHRWKSKEKPA